MKITKEQLNQLIKEEISKFIKEGPEEINRWIEKINQAPWEEMDEEMKKAMEEKYIRKLKNAGHATPEAYVKDALERRGMGARRFE